MIKKQEWHSDAVIASEEAVFAMAKGVRFDNGRLGLSPDQVNGVVKQFYGSVFTDRGGIAAEQDDCGGES